VIARALLVLVVLVLGAARAEADKPRVAVTGDAEIAKAVRGALAGKVELVEVGTSAASPAALAEQHRLHAVIVVSATGKVAVATLHQGADGRALDSFKAKVSRKLMARRIASQIWKKLGDKITSARAPAPAPGTTAVVMSPAAAGPKPSTTGQAPGAATGAAPNTTTIAAAPAGRASDDRSPATSGATTSGATGDDGASTIDAGAMRVAAPRREARVLVLGIEERPFWRRLRYNDDLDDRLRPSDLAANAVAISATWRPLRKARGLALVLRGERAVGVNGSRTTDGTELTTSTSEWSASVGYDIPIRTISVGIGVAYGEHRFAVGDEMLPAELVPDVTYRFGRAGLSVAVPLSPRLELTVGGGWRQLLSMGELEGSTWFPRATGNGLDACAGITLRVTSWLAFHARVDLRRYFFAMNPEPGDTWIAGGATDQYFGGALGASISPR
jgi:hypothetical protein